MKTPQTKQYAKKAGIRLIKPEFDRITLAKTHGGTGRIWAQRMSGKVEGMWIVHNGDVRRSYMNKENGLFGYSYDQGNYTASIYLDMIANSFASFGEARDAFYKFYGMPETLTWKELFESTRGIEAMTDE